MTQQTTAFALAIVASVAVIGFEWTAMSGHLSSMFSPSLALAGALIASLGAAAAIKAAQKKELQPVRVRTQDDKRASTRKNRG